jgi:ribosomal protein S18 acetylase RimI-like enzyme
MTASPITDPAHRDMPFFRAVYEDAFPEDERCPWERMAGFLSQPGHHFRLEGLYLDDGTPIGFNAFSLFGHYLYGIYLAFDQAYRAAGYGHRALTDFRLRHLDRLLFGEIEHPVTPRAQQRLAFYQSLGYHVTDIGFVQPPLRPGLAAVPYLIISYPSALTPDDADAIREILTTVIYRGR